MQADQQREPGSGRGVYPSSQATAIPLTAVKSLSYGSAAQAAGSSSSRSSTATERAEAEAAGAATPMPQLEDWLAEAPLIDEPAHDARNGTAPLSPEPAHDARYADAPFSLDPAHDARYADAPLSPEPARDARCVYALFSHEPALGAFDIVEDEDYTDTPDHAGGTGEQPREVKPQNHADSDEFLQLYAREVRVPVSLGGFRTFVAEHDLLDTGAVREVLFAAA